jgi:hypothetical protein
VKNIETLTNKKLYIEHMCLQYCNNQKASFLHIEVDGEHRNEAKDALEGIYNAEATGWPLHLRMRAVPLFKDVMTNSQVKTGVNRLIGCQASFNNDKFGKKKINLCEIKELDFEAAGSGKTLRDMIMEIPQQDDPTKNLFHSVDHLRSTNRATVVLTRMPVLESEARNIISSLAAYLKHRHGDKVIEFFTKDAQVRARESYWDEERRRRPCRQLTQRC